MTDPLLQVAAEIVRGTGVCEKGHRNGEANPHFHDELVHSWGRRLAALYHASRGAEAELLALRPVVEAAVAWAIPWKEPEEAMAANGALVDAVAHYQRGLSGRAASPLPDEDAAIPGLGDNRRTFTATYRRADAARASREPSE